MIFPPLSDGVIANFAHFIRVFLGFSLLEKFCRNTGSYSLIVVLFLRGWHEGEEKSKMFALYYVGSCGYYFQDKSVKRYEPTDEFNNKNDLNQFWPQEVFSFLNLFASSGTTKIYVKTKWF